MEECCWCCSLFFRRFLFNLYQNMMRRLSHTPYTYKVGWRSGDVCNLRTRIILVRIADHKKKEQSQKHAKKSPFFSPNYHYLLFLLLLLLLLLLSLFHLHRVYSLALLSVTVCVAMPMGIKIETISNETGHMKMPKRRKRRSWILFEFDD